MSVGLSQGVAVVAVVISSSGTSSSSTTISSSTIKVVLFLYNKYFEIDEQSKASWKAWWGEEIGGPWSKYSLML